MSTVISLSHRVPGLFAPVPADRPLLALGLAMLAAVPLTLLALLIDPRVIGADSVWLKPLKFQLATGVHLATVALCLAALAPGRRAERLTRWLVAAIAAAALFEVAYITLRGGTGLPSHFATDPIGRALFPLMGIAIVALVAASLLIGVKVLRHPAPAVAWPVALGVGVGLVVSGVAGLLTGITISTLGGPVIGAAGGPALPVFGWSGVAGDLRVSHFFGLHAAKLLPLAALMLAARAPRRAVPAFVVTAALWSGLAIVTYVQALAGRPFLAL